MDKTSWTDSNNLSIRCGSGLILIGSVLIMCYNMWKFFLSSFLIMSVLYILKKKKMYDYRFFCGFWDPSTLCAQIDFFGKDLITYFFKIFQKKLDRPNFKYGKPKHTLI